MDGQANNFSQTATLDGRTLQKEQLPWWQGAAIYQVYPRSFYDKNGDGTGDLPGITQKLSYIATLGVDAIWLSPFFTSPMADFGYDVADFCDIDPVFGNLRDFDTLVDKAHRLGLKVIIDQIYSHSSDQHPWFHESRQSPDNTKADWYVWADPQADGSPPNNWQSVFTGSAWQWDARRGQYYLHNFLPEQPDLNLHNPDVQDAILDVTKFWLERGVDGFRLDALNFGFHNRQLTNNPPVPQHKRPPTRPHDFQHHVHNMSQPEIYPFLERIRKTLDGYQNRFTVAEIGGPFPLDEMKAYTQGTKRLNTSYAFDFLYAEKLTASLVRETLAQWPNSTKEGWPSWAFSNHDAPRAVSRWCGSCPKDRYAKLIFLLMITLRGNIFLYQGEELGLCQSKIQFKDLKDPEAIANWPHTLGRDGARTPMPWHHRKRQAGFSRQRPWLPLDPNHSLQAVNVQQKTAHSVLRFYQDALRLRNNTPALKYGEITFVDCPADLLVFTRHFEAETLKIVINLTDQKIAYPSIMGDILFTTDHFTATGDIPPWSAAVFRV